MSKKELRHKYKLKRESLEDTKGLSLQIIERLKKHVNLKDKVVSVFIPIEKLKEINTWPLFEPVHDNTSYFCVPRIERESKEMQHFLFEGKTQLVENDWGILEPKSGSIYGENEIDIVLVPLLAYDQKGNRVGYGGGYYDRFLSKCRPDVLKIGLSFFPPEKHEIASESTDIPLDYCITPEKVYEFKG